MASLVCMSGCAEVRRASTAATGRWLSPLSPETTQEVERPASLFVIAMRPNAHDELVRSQRRTERLLLVIGAGSYLGQLGARVPKYLVACIEKKGALLLPGKTHEDVRRDSGR